MQINSRVITKMFKKSSVWGKIFFVFLLVISALLILNITSNNEGFDDLTQAKQIVVNKGTKVFDNYYSNVYDKLFYNKRKNDFEVDYIVTKTKPNKHSNILDIGSGTGHHVAEFTENGINALGIDLSPSMVSVAKKTHPHSRYRVGDVMDGLMFTEGYFTHITCLFFTIYYIQDKRRFFENCYKWLKPGGFIIIHLVDRDNYNYAQSEGGLSQLFNKERVTSKVAKINGNSYRANVDYNPTDNEATISEQFKESNTGVIRKNEHQLFMPTQERILSFAKDVGFILHSQTNMKKYRYDHQYIYILQKPN